MANNIPAMTHVSADTDKKINRYAKLQGIRPATARRELIEYALKELLEN